MITDTRFDHHHAELDGVRMHYVTHGQGQPIVLLHGFPEYWGVWKQVMAELGKAFFVVAPDLRGYHLSARPDRVGDYHVRHVAGDVRALIAHLGLGDVTLVGQDWGGLVGWSVVLRHPECMARYVTIDITHPVLVNRALAQNPAQQAASQYMLQFRSPAGEQILMADDFAFLRAAVFDVARQNGAVLSDADVDEWVATWKQPGALTAGLNYYRAAEVGPPDGGKPGGSNLIDDLDADALHVHVPVLVLWAANDPYLLATGLYGLETLVSDLTIRHVPNATHWLTLEKPNLVAAAIAAFVRRPAYSNRRA